MCLIPFIQFRAAIFDHGLERELEVILLVECYQNGFPCVFTSFCCFFRSPKWWDPMFPIIVVFRLGRLRAHFLSILMETCDFNADFLDIQFHFKEIGLKSGL